MSDSLKHKTISGVVWSGLQRFGTMIISLLTNIILARQLTPSDFGEVGMLTIFVNLASTFIADGFVSALIQKKDLNKIDTSTVFWWNIVAALIVYVILWLFSPTIANFYNMPQLSIMLKVQGLYLIFFAIGVVQITLARKNMDFKRTSIISLLAASAASLIGIIMAYSGFGVWSLIFYQLLVSIFTSLGFWITTKWYPNLCFSIKSFKETFSYAVYIMMSNLLNTFSDNVQGIIIGKYFSAYTMGCYSQAKRLVEIPSMSISQVVSQVAFPLFSQVQDDRKKLFALHSKSVKIISFVTIPMMAILYIVAEPLLILMYGNQWFDAIPLFKILCISGAFTSLLDINYYVVAAVGKSKQLFRWNIVKRIFVIGFIIAGFLGGVKGVLYGMVCGSAFIYVVNSTLASSYSGYSFWSQTKDIMLYLIISIIIVITISLISISFESLFLDLLIKSIIFAISYIICVFVVRRSDLMLFYGFVKDFINKK